MQLSRGHSFLGLLPALCPLQVEFSKQLNESRLKVSAEGLESRPGDCHTAPKHRF